MSKIIIGSQYHKRLYYKDVDGALTDPTSVVALMRRHGDASGGGTVTVNKDAVGVYDIVATPDVTGVWWLEVTGTGPDTFADRVDEYTFTVTESGVA